MAIPILAASPNVLKSSLATERATLHSSKDFVSCSTIFNFRGATDYIKLDSRSSPFAPYPNVSEASLDTPPAQSATSASPPLPSEAAAAATLACAAASSRLAAEKSDLSSASIRDLVVSSAERSAQ